MYMGGREEGGDGFMEGSTCEALAHRRACAPELLCSVGIVSPLTRPTPTPTPLADSAVPNLLSACSTNRFFALRLFFSSAARARNTHAHTTRRAHCGAHIRKRPALATCDNTSVKKKCAHLTSGGQPRLKKGEKRPKKKQRHLINQEATET